MLYKYDRSTHALHEGGYRILFFFSSANYTTHTQQDKYRFYEDLYFEHAYFFSVDWGWNFLNTISLQ